MDRWTDYAPYESYAELRLEHFQDLAVYIAFQ